MLKVLMLRKKIDAKQKELESLRAKESDFAKREAELEQAIEEAAEGTEEEQAAVEEMVDAFEEEKAENEKAAMDLERTIAELEGELEAAEEKQGAEPEEGEEEQAKEPEARKDERHMEVRNKFGLTEEMVKRDHIEAFLRDVREAGSNKRALTNVGLTIPEEFVGILKENVINYSKLYKHVYSVNVSGQAREVIMGSIPEAVWTDCCANLNELDLVFNDVEVDCHKLGGFFAVCNATLEDSDIALASEIIEALSQAIGYALDKAILYGTGVKMPLGIVSRLAQTAAPADYPATARPWVDLHTSNILSIPAGTEGAELISAIVQDFSAAKGKYSRGEKVWVMNESTYTKLGAYTITTAADGSIVSGVFDRMPVVGGVIEVLDFVPDDVIIGGFFDLYLLAQRAGVNIQQSEHVRFLADQTVFKGVARYDGTPRIAEGFVAIGLNGVTPSDSMTFAADTAN